MSDVIMSAMIPSAVQAALSSGGAADVRENGEAGEFGQLLGAMMSVPTEETAVIDAVPVTDEALEQTAGIDAFMAVLGQFLAEGETTSESIKELWANVSDEDKAVFVQLLNMAVSDIDEMSPAQAMKKLIFEGAKLKKAKDAETENEDQIIPEAAAAMAAAPEITVEITVTVTDSEGSMDIAPDIQIVLSDEFTPEDLQSVYKALENASPEELKEFCNVLAGELKAEITATEQQSAGGTELAEIFGSSRQAVMSRVSRPLDTENEPDTTPVQQAVQEQTVQEESTVNVFEITENMFTREAESTESIAQTIIERISEIRQSAAEVTDQITLKLDPEELGEIVVKITHSEKGVSIAFAAERSEAAGMIGDRAAALAETMASRGVDLREISVTQQIISARAEDNALAYMGSGQDQQFSQGGSGRRFVYEDGAVTEITSDDDFLQNAEIYYNREAKLWVSA